MKKLLEFLNRWGVVIIVSLSLLVFMKECSTSKRVKKLEKANTELSTKIDTLNKKTVDAETAKHLIKTVSATQTLIDEELIDKKQLTLTDLYKELQ
ncbi:MAG: hypothetical protein IKO56_09505 [Alphaproteobacteria bacterium]|nr:hypothetical protein [Alphaproteobacteria bacterium]